MSMNYVVSIPASARIALCVLALTLAVRPLEAQQPQTVRVPVPVLERYVGEYEFDYGGTVEISLRGDTLIRRAGTQQLILTPLSETRFMMGPFFTAEFVIDDAGRVTQVVSDGVDIEFRGYPKGYRPAAPASPAAAAPAVRVPRSVLEQYVGVYEYIPGQMSRQDLRVVIALKGDTLTRRMRGEDTVLTPVSETQFRVGDTSLMVEFVIDDAGVTQIMGSGFQQMLSRLTSKN